jgi:5-methylcytosine-specific restriction protein A
LATFFSTENFCGRKVGIIKSDISKSQIEATYAIAKRVYAGELQKAEGAKLLNQQHGMNVGSARFCIEIFQHMLKGLKFTRTINAIATDYYLTNIYNDYGSESLGQAISAIQKHIEYFEGLGKGKPRKLREIVNRHSALLHQPINLEKFQKSFSEKVENSLHDSTEARKKRLNAANKQPKKAATIALVFIRNPDVVAEVLLRANGQCERCKRKAPFLRRKDKTPYLEVHHTIQLAAGGEDAVENAAALCPNCHRELHFG